jgi:chemotaxis protein histidine kinase CheA
VDSANHQKILGYFIEEAKEHLVTLEKGLMDLPTVVADQEKINEMFRAAHSVKGGAAMLGLGSIQKTAHRLEDSFKVLQEHRIKVDNKLETFFLGGYDTLKDLVERLQGPFGLREEEAEETMKAAEPNFVQLQDYLGSLVKAASQAPSAAPAATQAPPANFAAQVMVILKPMLQLFKQAETPNSRKQLLGLCDRLGQLGAKIDTWQTLVKATKQAIANSKVPFNALAPVVIKELKTASDLVQAGKAKAIVPSPTLQKLAAAAAPAAAATTSTTPQQVTIPLEPKAAAKVLIKAFNKKQLLELVKILVQVVR